MKAVRYHEVGPPEVLRYEDVDKPSPGAGDVLIRVAAVGVNWSEVSRRAGDSPLMPGSTLPMVPGYECSGVIESTGEGVTDLKPGDRVIGRALPHTYMEYVAAPAARVYKLPDSVDLTEAATVISGLTMAWQAVVHCAKVQQGDTVLVHAVGSGTGIACVQVAKAKGATVIGTASSDDKLKWAEGYGLDHGINYATGDFVAEVNQITDGKGVGAVIEGLGGDYLLKSLKCLAPYGRVVNYGRAGGPRSVEVLLPELWGRNIAIMGAGSGTPSREETASLLEMWARGDFKATVDRTWPLAEAAAAHHYIEDRKVKGRIALTVSAD
jgi:NADPH2:quinone reductase